MSNSGESFRNKEDSVPLDNWETAIKIFFSQFVPLNSPIVSNFKGYLVTRTVAIDVDFVYLKNHVFPSGQKFHCLRAPNESLSSAYNHGCEFIRLNAAKWVELTLQIKTNGPLVVNTTLRERAIENLAFALHCLQDTFSPSHTERAISSDANKPGRIKDIFVYENQNHNIHSAKDYNAGSTSSLPGESAINASTELMLMCVKAVSLGTYLLPDWDVFQDKWIGSSLI